MSFGTMGINAHVISGLDPGAIPGGSTIFLRKRIMGPISIDRRVKVQPSLSLSLCDRLKIIVANDNFASDQALAA